MPGPAEPDQRRLALLVAAAQYQDPALRGLRSPGRDASALAIILGDRRIGGFDVQTLVDARCHEVQEGIEEFCSDRNPDDQLLVYLSCHGLLDGNGRLYYAATDTRQQSLAATAVSAAWLTERLDDCRARSQILVLDCCHSGAFARGNKGDRDSVLDLKQRFQPTGRGRVVLTASRATEYSFEGDQASGEGLPSVFTRAVVDGLKSGEADRDRDGLITVSDLYNHVYETVRQAEPRQTPELWLYGAEGDLLIARSIRGAAQEPPPLPGDLQITLESPRAGVRTSAVAELARLLDTAAPGMVRTAQQILRQVAEQDVPAVAAVARAALRAAPGEATRAVAAATAAPPTTGAAEPVPPAAADPPAAPSPRAPQEPAAAVPKAGPEPAGASGVAATVRAPWRPGRRLLAGAAAVLAAAGVLAGARAVLAGGPAPSPHPPASAHWPASLPGQVYTRPYAIGGRLYMGDQNGYVYALNAFTGALRWQYPLKGQPALASINARPGVADHKVYVVTSNGHLYALDAANGTLKWSYPKTGHAGSAPTSPVYLDGKVFFGSGSVLYRVSAKNGEGLRPVQLAGPISGVLADSQHAMGTPLRQRTLYVGAGSYLYALNPANGQVHWRHWLGSGAAALPSLSADGGTVFVDTEGTLHALNTAKKGRPEWHYPISGQAQYQPAVANGVVYVGTSDYVYAVTTDGHIPSGWPHDGRVRLPGGSVSGPVVAFGKVFVGSDRWLSCLDASTGRRCGQWPPFHTDGLVATPVLANGRVYAGTIGGHVYAVSVMTGTM
ncbi:MAG TPA: PQQ-binding-like beta-propeller repeat protein [Streptosporangiaceae bacterium]|nr:PQQ-binding-like beta-propeller repeat protein [Streptosporangiaceae bacterium]